MFFDSTTLALIYSARAGNSLKAPSNSSDLVVNGSSSDIPPTCCQSRTRDLVQGELEKKQSCNPPKQTDKAFENKKFALGVCGIGVIVCMIAAFYLSMRPNITILGFSQPNVLPVMGLMGFGAGGIGIIATLNASKRHDHGQVKVIK